MYDNELKVNSFLMTYCRRLLEEIPEERMTEQPVTGINHPAWILGHLSLAADTAAALLGAEKTLPADWGKRYGTGSKPSASRAEYPSKAELLATCEKAYERVRRLASTANAEQLAQPTTIPQMKEMLPTTRERMAFMLTGHVGAHLGQLSAWRRMIGLPAMF
jgi:hypothetical protein